MGPLINSVIYSVLGIAILVLAFILIDLLTPGKLWDELLDKKNTALAIVVAGVAVAVGLIIASAIH